MEIQIKLEISRIIASLISLLIFGILYNWLVARWERKGYTEGYLSLIVALGVGITLAGLAWVSWQAALMGLIGFVFSGTPMILGSISRHIHARECAMKAMHFEALSDEAEDE